MPFNKQDILRQLQGGDLRSLALVDQLVVTYPASPELIDLLVELMMGSERLIAMRAADALEKLTRESPALLVTHSDKILTQLYNEQLPIEIKWHLAQLLPRLPLTAQARKNLQEILTSWILNRKESRLVRVHALQGLFELRTSKKDDQQLLQILNQLGDQEVPALVARIKQFKSQLLKRQA